MIHAIPYLIPYLIPACMAAGSYQGGLAGFAIVFWIYIAVPWLDSLLGRRRSFQLGSPATASPTVHRFCRVLLWLWIPTQAAMLWGAMWSIERHNLGPLPCWAMACSLGLAGGVVGFTVVHELAHAAHRWETALALLLASMFSYPHFCLEHVHGHHRNVGTLNDPATARLGETLYAFFFRCTWNSLRLSWRREAQRLRARGQPSCSAENRMLQGAVLVAVIYFAVWLGFGWRGVLFFLGQSFVSVFLLEATNYVQHYGLVRREIAPGRFEPVAMHHAWNVEHRLTNWLLFNLGRHSEHHCEARRPYQELNSPLAGPVLPLGLSGMVVLAFFPPLWQYVMDHKAQYWRTYGEQLLPQPTRQQPAFPQGEPNASAQSSRT